MIFDETKRLLAYIHGFDKRELSDLVATSWTDVLEDVEFLDAKATVKAFFTTPGHGYLDITDIIEGVQAGNRQLPSQVEADVRVAKIKGIVTEDWRKDQPLPARERAMLAAARARDHAVLDAQLNRQIESPVSFEAGVIGREVPRV